MNTSLSINFLGDVMPGERFEKIKKGVKSTISGGDDPFFYCRNELSTSDLNVANLECVLSSFSTKSFPFSESMRSGESAAELLKEYNIKVVNLANNHILDHGEKAFSETKEILTSYGIEHFGLPKRHGFQEEPLVVDIKGKRLSLLGYDLSNLNRNEFKNSANKIVEIVKSNSGKADLLIVSLHWGLEYTDRPTTYQVKAAKEIFDAGCNIIYGHHPHILQGVSKFGSKIFMPSLGNFIFDDEREWNRKTGIVKIIVDEDQNMDYIFSPYFINKKYQPVPDPSLSDHFHSLNIKLKEVLEAEKLGETEIDKQIFEMSEYGHRQNQKRVRKLLIKNFYTYLPFLIPIVIEKIIRKRVLKRKK